MIYFRVNKDSVSITEHLGIIPDELEFPKGPSIIAKNSFQFMDNLRSIQLPHGYTKIGSGAFAHNQSLCEVYLPDSLETIESYAFTDCNIKLLILPEFLTHLGKYAFSYCTNLKTVISGVTDCTFDKNVFSKTHIDTLAFYNMSKELVLNIISTAGFKTPNTLITKETESFYIFKDLSFKDFPYTLVSGGIYMGYPDTYLLQGGFANLDGTEIQEKDFSEVCLKEVRAKSSGTPILS